MKRFKWYRTTSPLPLRELGSRLNASRFTTEAPNGFVLDRVRDDFVEGRYVERNEVQSFTVDPFGGEYQYSRIEFQQWQFRVTDEQPGLELIGSTRGSRALANRLAELSDFRLSIEDFNVDPMKWLRAVVQELNADGYVDIVQVGSVEIESGVTARTTITGKIDVQEAVKSIVGSRSYSIAKLRFKFTGSQKGAITLSNAASATIKLEDPEHAEDCVRSALREIY